MKISKHAALGLKASSGKKTDPLISLQSDHIPFPSHGVKFLGLHVDTPQDSSQLRAELLIKFNNMLDRVDSCPLTSKQKLLVFRSGVCPRISWDLTVVKFPLSWVRRNLDSLATRYLKSWSGLARSANPALLFLSGKNGGLNLPLPSTMHKTLQSSHQSHLLTSPDPCVRCIAEDALKKDLTLTRPSFRASREVREVMSHNPDISKKSLRAATKAAVTEEDEDPLLNSLQRLKKQGHMSRCSSSDGVKLWAKALGGIDNSQLRFALNSAVDTLPHNANLALWKKCDDNTCPLCGERQTLIHVLNTCKASRDGRRYNTRHNSILSEIVSLLSSFVAPPTRFSADLGSYIFPHHIVSSDLRPDIVCWNDVQKSLILIELTVSFDTSFQQAAERKRAKYCNVIERAQSAGFHAQLFTLQVGSRGIVDISSFIKLKKAFGLSKQDINELLLRVSRVAIVESYNIWCRRNTPE